MNQRQVILAVVAVGLMAAALWYWHGSPQREDVAVTPVKGTASMQDAFHGAPGPAPVEPPPLSGSAATIAPAPVPEVAPPPVSAPAEPPQSVDTPEPAQRKFGRGTKPEESGQN